MHTFIVKVSYTCKDGITGKEETGTETLKIREVESIEEAKEYAEEIVHNLEIMNCRISNFKVISVKKV